MELVTCAKVLWILWACAFLGCSFKLKDCKFSTGHKIQLDATPGLFEIRCLGATKADRITWLLAADRQKHKAFASCGRCKQTHCPECVVRRQGYRVTRNRTVSTLTVPGSAADTLYGNTIACAAFKRDSARCKVEAPLELEASTCPEFVAEGDDLRCWCRHPLGQRGSPRATVEWLGHPTEQGVLQIANVTRDMNGKVFTCRASWPSADAGIRDQHYVLNVAYGPDSVTMTSSAEDEATQDVTFTCEAHGVNPLPLFRWNVHCTSLTTTGSVGKCTVSQADLKGADRIQCSAMNSELNVHAVYETKNGALERSWKAYVIGGVVAALVAAGVVLVVMAVVFKRKKSRGAGRHTSSDQQPGPTRSTEQISQAPDDDYLTPLPYNPEEREAAGFFVSEDKPEAVRRMNLTDSKGYSVVPADKLQGGRVKLHLTSEDKPEAVLRMNLTDSKGYSVVPADMQQGGRVKLHLTSEDKPEAVRRMNLTDSKGYSVVRPDMLQGGRVKLHLTSEDKPEAVRRMNLTDSSGYSVVPADMQQGGRVKLHLTSEDKPEAVRRMNLTDSNGYSVVPADMQQGGRVKLHLTSEDKPEAVRRMNLTDSSGYSEVPADMQRGGRVKLHLTRQRPREPPRSTEQLGGRDSAGYEVPRGTRV